LIALAAYGIFSQLIPWLFMVSGGLFTPVLAINGGSTYLAYTLFGMGLNPKPGSGNTEFHNFIMLNSSDYCSTQHCLPVRLIPFSEFLVFTRSTPTALSAMHFHELLVFALLIVFFCHVRALSRSIARVRCSIW